MTNRLQRTSKTNLSTRSLTKAINTYVTAPWPYSYGRTSRPQTDVEKLEINIRTKLTEARVHHKNCNSEISVAEKEGDLAHNLHNNQVKLLKNYFNNKNNYCLHRIGVRGGAVGWGTALQAGRSRVRFPMVSLEFFIDIALLAALWPWDWLSLQQKWVPGIFPGGKEGRCVGLTTLPPSFADCLEI